MSVTFTPVQSWIALGMFAMLMIFVSYIFVLNIGQNQRQEEAKILADQRSINATRERQDTLNKTQTLLIDTKHIEDNLQNTSHNSEQILNRLNTDFNPAYKEKQIQHLNSTANQTQKIDEILSILKNRTTK